MEPLPALLDSGLRQPNAFTCGAQSVVMAAALAGREVPGDAPALGRLVLATHRRLTSYSSDAHLQVPWPRRLGTPPWAVAREMRHLTGQRYRVRAVVRGSRARWWSEVGAAVAHGHPVPVYVGNHVLPRHVVLAVRGEGDDLLLHDPATGHLRSLTHSSWQAARLRLSGWDVPWFVVVPH